MTPPPLLDAGDALFLDFDGTLAGIVADPDAARIDDRQAMLLLSLSKALDGALAVVSGRALDDLAARVPAGLMRVGGHGLQAAGPDAAVPARPGTPEGLIARLGGLEGEFPGVRVEAKGPVVAIHYRAAPKVRVPLGNRLAEAAGDMPGYALHGGKAVYELKPQGADKGAALSRLMTLAPFAGRRPVMVGDDVTDEDAFAAATRLGGHGIKVGSGPTSARYRLSGVPGVWLWLADLV